ncbi:hypothetical protein BJF86_09905 [Serinicoccus sp. CNJ-927]|uniref:DUF2304 domain-containing protein n=1 Tax=Serinicoccus sp. CNJ-927 TaxID=1904970 RepID=UPI000965745F|nr:DUF2304 domain-containing protein [Serinicoccus sp. CNJ-927]OLT38928.1 hypothetical protein BJF86_09905 [Serinicoccus sp. CNJ-927]
MLDQPVIKLVLLVSVVVVTAMLTRSTAGVRHQAVRRLLLVAFVVLAAVAILFPRVLTQVAQLLGVGRGADLLLYGLTVVFLGYVAASYRRMRQLEQQVTTLARELALRAAVHDTTEHDTTGHDTAQHEPPRSQET